MDMRLGDIIDTGARVLRRSAGLLLGLTLRSDSGKVSDPADLLEMHFK
jgi:hypothetical protein